MATVALANIYNPVVFGRGVQAAQTEKNAFIRAGIVVEDAQLRQQLSVGGNIGEIAFFNPLATGEPNYSTDNPATLSTPANVSGTKQIYRAAPRNKSWSVMDLSRELALIDPVGAITGRIGGYWATDDQKRLIQSCLGILANNIAADASDMLFSVATDGAGAVADAERISAETVVDGEQTLGDAQGGIAAMAIHSVIYARLKKQNLIDFIPLADQSGTIATYLGKRLIVDDGLPAIAGANRITYTSILFGPGAVLTAPGRVNKPSAMERNEDAGNGGGEEVIYSRVNNVFHPNGFSFISGSVAGQSATYAELALAANWDRVVARKSIPLAFIRTND
jgi:hypothetical protein